LSTLPSNAYPPYQGGGGGNYIPQLPHSAGPLDGSLPYHTAVDSVLAEQDVKASTVTNNNGYVPTVQLARRCMHSRSCPPWLSIR
jgi:hypothetical protein